MPIHTTDVRSNRQEQMVHAVTVIGRSEDRRLVFEAIYRGKRKAKTVTELMQATGLDRVRVLHAGEQLAGNHLVGVAKMNAETAYEKDAFYTQTKGKILNLLSSKSKPLVLTPPQSTSLAPVSIKISIPQRLPQADHVTIDDIEPFDRLKRTKTAPTPKPLTESIFKNGIKRIIGEQGEFHDWGGESNDLFSTRLRIHGKRISAAFAFKGKGTTGVLTPKKMGKNGDQIQRLFRSTARVYLVQYWGQIDESVLEQLEKFATAKSAREGKKICYGIVDGHDTSRIIKAYPEFFTSI